MIEAERQHRRAVNPGRRGAKSDQHIHVAAAAAHRVPAADVEAPADPELNRRRQGELQPARQHIRMPPHFVTHAEHERHLCNQRQGKRQRDPEALHFRAVGRFLARLLFAARIRARRRRRKTGLDDGGDEFVDVGLRRVETDMSAFRRQIHHGFDTGQFVELSFDAPRAGGAGHAADGQFDGFAGGHDRISRS